MAKRRSAIGRSWLWPGIIAATLILAVAILSFSSLLIYSPQQGSLLQTLKAFFSDRYLRHVVAFTFQQALFSTVLSVIPAVFVAFALYRRVFVGRALLLKLYSMTLVLPVLVAVFGLLSIYGQRGWLATLLGWFNIEYGLSIYGFPGIILAHVFFNLPLASRLLLQALDNIAVEQRQLAAQLGMSTAQRFRLVEWPVIKRQLAPTSALIFMLCFASFATVLSLGGGPKATTIELAIYQALRYDFDLTGAALLALTQLFCCLTVMLFSLRLNSSLPISATLSAHWRDPNDSTPLKLFDVSVITLAIIFIIPPLLAIVIDGLNASIFAVLQEPRLWSSIVTSINIAAGSALLCVSLTIMLLWTSRELSAIGQNSWAKRLELSGMTILAMPAIVIATGFFIFFVNTTGLPQSPLLLVTLINGMMAIPYALKVLTQPMYDINQRYRLVCQSLAITGIQRLRLIELSALKKPITQAFAFSCMLSVGDFGVIALFGNDRFTTLPYFLYEQLGAYRSQNGAVTALILLTLCFALFTLIERLSGHHDKS